MRYKFGSIGVGNMGGAILNGAVLSGAVNASDIAICDKSEAAVDKCLKLGYNVLQTPEEVYSNCEMVLFAIKPQGISALLEELSAIDRPHPLIISIVAGITEERIHASLPGAPVVLVMPNTPLLLGCGASALARGKGVKEEDFSKVMKIFEAMGEAREIPADRLCEVIPLNGSSPAFVYYFIECLAQWGVRNGIEYSTALTLTAKTFEGAAKMVLAGNDEPNELIRKVCSPGGATLEGMAVLKEQNAMELLSDVAEATVNRAYELGKM